MKHNTKNKWRKNRYDVEDATVCTICKEDFQEGVVRCRDHDHTTGKYRGCTHQKCNINYFCNRFIPAVLHNLKGYDGHFIIDEANKIINELGSNTKLDDIPLSSEKRMPCSVGCLRFIDSYQLLSASLDDLVKIILILKIDINNLITWFSDDQLQVLCQKVTIIMNGLMMIVH